MAPNSPQASNSTAPAPPLTVRLFMLSSWLLGGLLTVDGLGQRLSGAYPHWEAVMPWLAVARRLGLQPLDVGWPLLVAGLCLIGAVFGVYLRRAWGLRMGGLICGLALFYFYLGTPLAAASLVCLFLPDTQAYLRTPARA